MCKRKTSTKRRGKQQPQELAATANPILDRTNYIPHLPEDVKEKGPNGQTIAWVEPDDAMVIPTSGKAPLKRVYLGLGWKGHNDQKIDVDCCCAPYVKGVRNDSDTVWFGNLRNRLDDSNYCTIKHSGDVLVGQQDKGKLEDLERMLVMLHSITTYSATITYSHFFIFRYS